MDRKRFSILVFVLSLLVLTLSSSMLAYDYHIAGTHITDGSEAFVDILNPTDQKAKVEFTAFFKKNKSTTFADFINPASSRRIDLSARLPAENAGLLITSDTAVAVEHFSYDPDYSAGFGSTTAVEPSFVWYFADGYSSESQRTFLFMTNPSERTADVGVTLYYDNGQKKSFNVELRSEKSRRLDLKEHSLPDKEFGIKITSTAPIVAETVNLDRAAKTASGGLGSTDLSDTWYFAEGYTSVSASERLHLMNPETDIAHVTVTLYYDDGETQSFDVIVDAFRKIFVPLNIRARDTEWFSIVVDSDVEIVAELSHQDSSYSAGHGGIGAKTMSEGLLFAGGRVGPMHKGYLALFNDYDGDASYNITFFYDDGTIKSIEGTAQGMSRSTVQLNKVALADRRFGFSIVSDIPLIAQHVRFDRSYSSGHSSFGIAFDASEEDESISVELIENVQTDVMEDNGITLVEDEQVDVSKFGNALGDLDAVKRAEYSVEGEKVILWVFSYSSKTDAKDGFEDLLSGALFELLERTPVEITNAAAYYIVTDKSEGYAMEWYENTVIIALAGEKGPAMLIIENIIGQNAPQKYPWSNRLFIAILVVLVLFLIRRLVKGRRDDERADEFDLVVDDVEEQETRPKKVAKSGKKKPESMSSLVKPAPPVKSVRDIETELKHEIKKEKKATKVMKKQAKKAKKDFEKMAKEASRPKPKKKAKPVKKAVVEKIVKEASRTAGRKESSNGNKARSIKDIAKVVEFDEVVREIPSYDEVFKMVNRDHDVIKSK